VETKLTAERAGPEDAAGTADMVWTVKSARATTGDAPRAPPPPDGGTEADVSAGEGATVGDGATVPPDPINILTVVKLKQILKAKRLELDGTTQIQRGSGCALLCRRSNGGQGGGQGQAHVRIMECEELSGGNVSWRLTNRRCI
jgi:hypothetical protein